MQEKRMKTFKASIVRGKLESGTAEEAYFKNGFEFINQDLAISTASLTELREGRIAKMSSELLPVEQ